jgi:hypothetical protein
MWQFPELYIGYFIQMRIEFFQDDGRWDMSGEK